MKFVRNGNSLPLTLTFYIGNVFLKRLAMMLAIISTIILLSSAIEVVRNIYGKNVPFRIILELAFLKYPTLVQRTLPFIIMFSGIMTFLSLVRSSELNVIRSFGISAWQFFIAPVTITFILGVLVITVIHPLSSELLRKQERLANKYLKNHANSVSISAGSIWLKDRTESNLIIRAQSLTSQSSSLVNATIFIYNQQGKFVKRLDAKSAELKDNYWHLNSAKIVTQNKLAETVDNIKIPTQILPAQLQDSFSPPETISFWELPSFIRLLKKAGFSALRHSLYLYNLILLPFFLCGCLLLSAPFALKHQRNMKIMRTILMAIACAFMIYFVMDVIAVLGLSGRIPIFVSALLPVIAIIFSALGLIFHLEDG